MKKKIITIALFYIKINLSFDVSNYYISDVGIILNAINYNNNKNNKKEIEIDFKKEIELAKLFIENFLEKEFFGVKYTEYEFLKKQIKEEQGQKELFQQLNNDGSLKYFKNIAKLVFECVKKIDNFNLNNKTKNNDIFYNKVLQTDESYIQYIFNNYNNNNSYTYNTNKLIFEIYKKRYENNNNIDDDLKNIFEDYYKKLNEINKLEAIK